MSPNACGSDTFATSKLVALVMGEILCKSSCSCSEGGAHGALVGCILCKACPAGVRALLFPTVVCKAGSWSVLVQRVPQNDAFNPALVTQ